MSAAKTKIMRSLALLAAVTPAVAQAIDMSDFLKNRVERFAVLSAEHPNQPAEIEQIKAKTAEMVAAAAPRATSLDAAPLVWKANDKPVVIFDLPVAPRMVVVPAGEFTMGAKADRHRVRIAKPFAVSMFPIIYGEFAAFVTETGYKPAQSCTTLDDGAFKDRPGHGWQNPGVSATPRDPLTCVSYADATAYAAWLSKKSGHSYRLLTEAEYEYIGRAGTAATYSWGDDPKMACTFANGYDEDAPAFAGAPARIACHDGQATASQVGVLKPNGFGLFDTSGNVESWTADCWNSGRTGPADGSAITAGNCRSHIVRGGSWRSGDLSVAGRRGAPVGQAASYRGFRLVRLL